MTFHRFILVRSCGKHFCTCRVTQHTLKGLHPFAMFDSLKCILLCSRPCGTLPCQLMLNFVASLLGKGCIAGILGLNMRRVRSPTEIERGNTDGQGKERTKSESQFWHSIDQLANEGIRRAISCDRPAPAEQRESIEHRIIVDPRLGQSHNRIRADPGGECHFFVPIRLR